MQFLFKKKKNYSLGFKELSFFLKKILLS
jgi:hypothetical protein